MAKKSKKILLVSSTSHEKMGEVKWLTPPLGILRLAGYLNSKGHHAEWIDTNYNIMTGEGPSLEDKLKEKKWDMIGFSVLDNSLAKDIENMYLAKKLCPDALLVAGGIEAQFNYQTVLDKSPCKIAILGEGEIQMLMLANDELIEKIPGIVTRRDAVPFDREVFMDVTEGIEWEKVPYEKYWDFYVKKYKGQMDDKRSEEIHTIRIFTHNYCPFGCTFCSSTNQLAAASGKSGVPLVEIEASRLLSLLKRIKSAHPRVRSIYFTDDNFTVNPAKLIKFCQEAVKRKLGLSFLCFARVSDMSDEVLSWMAKANFRLVNMGVESFSQKVLDELNKKYKAEETEGRVRLVKKHGIHPFVSVILITPESNLDDVEITVDKTMALVEDGTATASVALACIPLKGADLYDRYYDFATDIIEISGTKQTIKRHYSILANDPYVREAQLKFYGGINKEIEKFIEEKGVKHVPSATQALIRLKFMKKIITDIRKKYNIKRGTKPSIYTEKSELMASQALRQVDKDKFQGI
jgi:radical SAM superfamily enzyme YgiQ (UPF0313 family)